MNTYYLVNSTNDKQIVYYNYTNQQGHRTHTYIKRNEVDNIETITMKGGKQNPPMDSKIIVFMSNI